MVSGSFTSPPSNDDICNATSISIGSTVSGNNTCATVQSGEVDPSSGSISPSNTTWHYFTAPTSGHVTVSTDHGGTTFDTEIAVYHEVASVCPGNAWGNLTEVGSDDDIILIINENSELELECLEPGDRYYIQIDGNDASDFGGYQVSVTNNGGPGVATNDDICDAFHLGTVGLGGSVRNDNFHNLCADTEPGEPDPGAFGIDQTIWFTFTTGASIGTQTTIEAFNDPLSLGDQIDLQVAVYTSSSGTCSGPFTEFDSDYFTPPFGESITLDCLEPNTTYWVQVDGSFINTEGYIGIEIDDNGVARSPNNDICNAEPLGTLPHGGTISGTGYNNFCADTEPGEADPSAFGIDQTMWFTFQTGPVVGYEVTFLAESDPFGLGDQIELQVALYTSSTGTCAGVLTEVDSDFDPLAPIDYDEEMVVECLEPNTTYFVQIDGAFLNVQGYFNISITDDGVFRPTNDDVCDADDLGTIPNGGVVTRLNQNNFCAGTEPGEAESLTWDIDQTVWYMFKPPASGSVEIDLTNSGSDDIDLQVAVWESSDTTCTGFFGEIESEDILTSFSINGTDRLRVKCLDTAKTYWIQVDGWPEPITGWLVEGFFELRVYDYGQTPAPNDSICDAIPLGDPTGGSVGISNEHNFCADNINEPFPLHLEPTRRYGTPLLPLPQEG